MRRLLLISLLLVAGCRQDMQNQPKMFPQRGSVVFSDHRSVRPQVEGTVARGQLDETGYLYTGGEGANFGTKDALPFAVSMTVLRRGEERFNVYCSPCHSRVGNGLGEIVQRGYKPAANLLDDVHRAQPLAHYFVVMTHGYGAMPDYAAQIQPEDRWAIAAYIRALQLSQRARREDVPRGVAVQSLQAVTMDAGLDAKYAGPWPQPAVTNVQANGTGGKP